MKFLKDNWQLLLAILVVAIIGGIVANMLTKNVQVDPVTGEPVPGGLVSKGKLNAKGLQPTIK